MPRLMDCAMASPVAHKIPEVTICVRTGFCASFVWYHAHTPRHPPTPAIAGWLTGWLLPILTNQNNKHPSASLLHVPNSQVLQLTYTHGGMTKSGNCDVFFPTISESTNLRDETRLLVRWGTEIDEEREEKRRGETGEESGHGDCWPWPRAMASQTLNDNVSLSLQLSLFLLILHSKF